MGEQRRSVISPPSPEGDRRPAGLAVLKPQARQRATGTRVLRSHDTVETAPADRRVCRPKAHRKPRNTPRFKLEKGSGEKRRARDELTTARRFRRMHEASRQASRRRHGIKGEKAGSTSCRIHSLRGPGWQQVAGKAAASEGKGAIRPSRGRPRPQKQLRKAAEEMSPAAWAENSRQRR